MRNERTSWFLSLIPLVALAACNTVTTGDNGVLTFTPDDCGEDGCSLNESLAIGGSTIVTVENASDHSDAHDVTLISSNPYVVQVVPVSDSVFNNEWRVTGVGPGYAELVAIDGAGYEIDHTDVDVRVSDDLDLEQRSGSAVGPTTRVGFDEVWTVNANQRVALQVAPYRGAERLMGKLGYQVDIDAALFATLDPTASLEQGELEFSVPMGEYDVTFVAPDGTSLRALIVAQ